MNMTCKDTVLSYLEQRKGEFVSGGKLAEELGVSRNAIWKAVQSLENAGYAIERVRGKGYRLSEESSILSAASIARYLANEDIHIEYHETVDSTNTRCKELAAQGAPEGTLVVANHQTAGRGRQGRPFYSPAGTGIYFSLLLRPQFPVQDLALVTTYTATVVAQAIEELFGVAAQIKWVNDVFVGGHKVCGILTEASFDAESGRLAHAVVGIGINVQRPAEGFPADIAPVASALDDAAEDGRDLRARLIARIADDFMSGYAALPRCTFIEAYRSRSLLDGRDVEVFEGTRSYRAHVLGVDDNLALRVRLEDGTVRSLSSGEVHIPSGQL